MGGKFEGAECFIQDSHEQCLGCLMTHVQNALFKIALKQCLRLLMMLDFEA